VLTLFHDYTSPASAVAVARLQRLADDGLPVEFEGFEAFGVDVTLPVTLDVVAAVDALAETARTEGLALRRPTGLPPTGLAHLVGALAEDRGLGASWRQACYRAYWQEDADISDSAVLRALAVGAGLGPDTVRPLLEDRGKLAALRRRMTGHRREGVGGVPTILAQRTLVPGLLPEADLRALAELDRR